MKTAGRFRTPIIVFAVVEAIALMAFVAYALFWK